MSPTEIKIVIVYVHALSINVFSPSFPRTTLATNPKNTCVKHESRSTKSETCVFDCIARDRSKERQRQRERNERERVRERGEGGRERTSERAMTQQQTRMTAISMHKDICRSHSALLLFTSLHIWCTPLTPSAITSPFSRNYIHLKSHTRIHHSNCSCCRCSNHFQNMSIKNP